MTKTLKSPVPAKIVEAATRRSGSAPAYLYDTEEIRRQCRRFTSIHYPNTAIHFASMANSSARFLALVKECGVGIFVNSLGHLRLAEEVGFGPSEIIFTASASSESVLRALGAKAVTVNLDSLGQVHLWNRLFPGQSFGIRCNLGTSVNAKETSGGVFLGPESRLGMTEDDIDGIEDLSLVRGLHMYVGTNILEISYFRECYASLMSLARRFPALDYVDVGGGFGVGEGSAQFDMDRYNTIVTSMFEDLSRELGRQVRLVIEPGRILASSSGYFVTTVTDIKYRAGTQLIGVNASSAQFPRPLFYPDEAHHPVWLLRDGTLNHPAVVSSKVYGCSTYSRDFLARDVELPEARVGDTIVFGHAGAYSDSSFTHFLGFDKPEEVYL